MRRIAGIVSAVCLVGLGALWWAVPCNLKVDVRVPEETRAELLAVFVLAQDPRGLYRIQAERQESFPDQQARSAAFTVRVPRGEYRVVVDCDGSDRFDERVRVITNRTVSVTLSAHPGRKAGSVEV